MECDWENALQAWTGPLLPSSWKMAPETSTLTQPHSITENFLCTVTHILGFSCPCFAPLISFAVYFISQLATAKTVSTLLCSLPAPLTHHVKTVCGSISTWAVSNHCFRESLGHNSYQDKSQGSFLPSSILFLPLPSWTAELAWFNHRLVAHMFRERGMVVGRRGQCLLTVCVFVLLIRSDEEESFFLKPSWEFIGVWVLTASPNGLKK